MVKHSAVGLKEFQRQVASQRKEIDGIELSNSVLAKTLSHLASGHDRDTLGTVEVLAGCPKVSEDIFLSLQRFHLKAPSVGQGLVCRPGPKA